MQRLFGLLRANRRRGLLFGAFCLAVVAMGYGAVHLADRIAATRGSAPPPNPTQTVTHDVKAPIERRPQAAGYRVAADQPKAISLPTLRAEGLIQRVGLTKANALAAPTNVAFAGWYTGSVRPGLPGLSIIDGHVSGKYSPGIFKDLSKLQKGDNFTVTYGDGSRRTFTVVDGKSLPESEAAPYLLQRRTTIARQLNLITCTGAYDRGTGRYDKRYVVVAQATD